MLSRFFIDRPIFAMVVSIIITLAGTIALLTLPVAQYPQITPPSVSVSISYPGANAQIVAETIAAPIEQSVNGVQGMLYMSSNSGSDGSYGLSVTFEVGTDLNTALVMVQNRVTLALPLLPSSVQSQGITVRKKTPDQLMIISLYTTEKNYTNIDLSNFAAHQSQGRTAARKERVSDVQHHGRERFQPHPCAWLDPRKLAARNLTAIDVAAAIRGQSLPVAAGQVGQPPASKDQIVQLPIDMLSRLNTPEQFGEIVIKAAGAKSQTTPAAKKAAPTPTSLPTLSTPQATLAVGTPYGGTSTSGGASSSGTSSGANTDGSTGGANTGGGATTGGAATSSGGATPGIMTPPMQTLSTNGLTAATVTQSTSTGAPMTGDVLTSSALISSGAQGPSPGIVRLKDLTDGPLELGAVNYNQYSSFDSHDAVGVTVYQLPGTNALVVADRVRARIKELEPTFPSWVKCNIGYDTTPYVRESIADVINTLFLAVALVGVVVLLFLQDWRAMILPMIDVPVSLIGTFGVMAIMGYSLNNISLFGLVLAIGIVVDDAIVVLENIERQLAMGLETRAATIKAMEEITGPILAITMVLCAVFVPCAFISGITGRFFRQFAVTISASMIISAVNALTMTPSRALSIFRSRDGGSGHGHKPEALPWWFFGLLGGFVTVWLWPRLPFRPADMLGLPSGWLELPREQEAIDELPRVRYWTITALHFVPGLLAGLVVGWYSIRPVNAGLGRFFRGFNRSFDRLTAVYERTVRLMLRFSPVVLLIYGGMLVLTVWEFLNTRTGFVPDQDQGRFIVSVQLPDAMALEHTKRVLDQMEKIAHKNPSVAHTITNSGVSSIAGANAPNYGSMFIILTPFGTRPDAQQLKGELQRAFDKGIVDGKVTVAGAAPIPGLSVAGGFKLIVEDRAGLTLDDLQQKTEA